MATFFTPGATLSVRARRALFESGNATTRARNNSCVSRNGTIDDDELSPEEMNDGPLRPSRLSSVSTIRKPLAFLSPNTKSRTESRSGGNESKENINEFKAITLKLWSGERQARKAENIAALKKDISLLQQQVHDFDKQKTRKIMCKTPTLTTTPEAIGSARKMQSPESNILQKLTEKLSEIQTGLNEIEDERENLFSKVNSLEREKYMVQSELSKREKEIVSLSRRCVLQADKTRNSAILQSVNKQLSRQISELQDEIHRSDSDHPSSIEELKLKLLEAEKGKASLEKKLSDICKDHGALSEKLRCCLDTCEQLTLEKREWLKQKHLITEQFNLEIQQLKFYNEEQSTKNQAEDQLKSQKITDLDNKLVERVSQIQLLHEELISLENIQAEERQKITQQFNSTLDDLSRNKKIEIDNISLQCEIRLQQYRDMVADKDLEIESLRRDVESQMEKLMSTSSILNEHEENTKLIENLTVDIEVLESERNLLKDDLHESETNIAELSAEILKLEIEKELLEQNCQSFIESRDKLILSLNTKESECKAFEKQLADFRFKSEELEKSIQSMNEQHMHRIAGIHMEHDRALAMLRAEIRGYEVKRQEEDDARVATCSAHDLKVHALGSRVRELELENQEARQKYESEINHVRASSSQLELELHQLKLLQSTKICKMTSELNDELLSLRFKLENQEKEAVHRQQGLQEKIELKDTIIFGLHDQIRTLTKDIAVRVESSRDDSVTIQRQLQTMKTQLMIKDDEIRELRLIELQEKDESITTLQEEISQHKETLEVNEKKASNTIADLQQRFQLLQQKYSHLEQQKGETDRKHAMIGEKQQKSIGDIKRDLDFASISIKDLERKLSDSTESRNMLIMQLEAQKLDNESLHSEVSQLRTQQELLLKQRDELKMTKDDGRRNQELGEIFELKQKCVLLSNDLQIAEKKIVLQQDQMANLENVVMERTEALASIVELNKQVETKLDASEQCYNDLEIKASNLQVEVMDCDAKISALRHELRRKEDEYLDQLHEEQNRREIAEHDLLSALNKLETVATDKRDLLELRKENQELKDKIHRQETFMQRKLTKDKVLRDRSNINIVPKNPASGMGRDCTPTRSIVMTGSKLPTPRSRDSNYNKSFQTKMNTRCTRSSSSMTRSTADETIESLEIELASLLAD